MEKLLLSSFPLNEDRIVEIAKQQLGMVRINTSVENVFVSKLRIDQIKRIVDSKYE